MRFLTFIVPTVLSFAASTYAWAQAADGTWVANNNWYSLSIPRRGDSQVHEACTWRNTNDVHNAGDKCAYWIDSHGNILNGECRDYDRVNSGRLTHYRDCY